MTEYAFAILLASAFTFGCAGIYEWREHARHLTPILTAVTAGLVFLTGLITLAQTGNVGPADDTKPVPRMARAQAPSARPETRPAAVPKPNPTEVRWTSDVQ